MEKLNVMIEYFEPIKTLLYVVFIGGLVMLMYNNLESIDPALYKRLKMKIETRVIQHIKEF